MWVLQEYRTMGLSDLNYEIETLEEIKSNIDKTQRAVQWATEGYRMVFMAMPIARDVLTIFFGLYSYALNEMDNKLTESLSTLKTCRDRINSDASVNYVRLSVYFKSYQDPTTADFYDLPYEVDPLYFY